MDYEAIVMGGLAIQKNVVDRIFSLTEISSFLARLPEIRNS